MLRKIEGKVYDYKPVSVRHVQFQLQGFDDVIDLWIEQPWVLRFEDYVVVVGEHDYETGCFKAYAYRNDTREVFGKYDSRPLSAYGQVLAGLLFCWVIFPLFTHLPAGLRGIARGRKADAAASMIAPPDQPECDVGRDPGHGRPGHRSLRHSEPRSPT